MSGSLVGGPVTPGGSGCESVPGFAAAPAAADPGAEVGPLVEDGGAEDGGGDGGAAGGASGAFPIFTMIGRSNP